MMRKVNRWIMVVMLMVGMVMAGVTTAQATIYVADNVACPGSGTQEAPYCSIQEAINNTADGDTVLVDDGIYTENINFNGLAITVQSVNGAANTIIDGSNPSDPDYGSVVIFNSGENENSVLDGFTITGGSGTEDPDGDSHGGGISCWSFSTPLIKNCNIVGNMAYAGGGIGCYGSSSPKISNCTITSNIAYGDDALNGGGGGIGCHFGSSPTINNCTINGNSSKGIYVGGGGIICVSGSSPTITNCTISSNQADQHSGGGVYCDAGTSPIITKCVISNNSAGNSGGGIYCTNSSPTINKCTISNNSAEFHGGGIECYDSSPSIMNCTITGNEVFTDLSYGGGIACFSYSTLTITNCTISNNSVWEDGGGVACWNNSSVAVVNSIFWENSSDEIYLGTGGAINITYSNIQGGWEGEGNIGEDLVLHNPLFVGNGDYHLQPGSPCIDAGTLTGAPEYDFEGDPRLASVGGDNMPDMGADEFVGSDSDGDGVPDNEDDCPDTPQFAVDAGVIGEDGCVSCELLNGYVNTQVPPDGEYKNHGDYVSQAARTVDQYVEAGIITEECAGSIMKPIAQSNVGKKAKH